MTPYYLNYKILSGVKVDRVLLNCSSIFLDDSRAFSDRSMTVHFVR